MFEVKVTVYCPDLAAAITGLAALMNGQARPTQAAQAAPAVCATQTAANVPTAPVAQLPPTAPPVTQTPPTAQPSTQAYTVVPTTPAPSFSHDQVGKAGADMIAANPAKMPELMALLRQYGVQAITQLAPEQLGAFATALRGMGAKI